MFWTVDLMQYHRATPGAIKTAESVGLDRIRNSSLYASFLHSIAYIYSWCTFLTNDLDKFKHTLKIVYEKFNDPISWIIKYVSSRKFCLKSLAQLKFFNIL